MRYCVAALWVSALTTLCVAADEPRHDAAAPHQSDNELELTEEDKRAWTNLHGGWGKRGWQDMSSAWGKRAWQDLNSAWGKRAWQDLNSAWGKRAWQDLNSAWGKRGWQDMSSAWGKEKWSQFHGSWGKRASEPDYEDYEAIIEQLIPAQQAQAQAPEAPDTINMPEKKAWSALHGAWGKRPAKTPHFNNGAFYWKREPGWTNLRGMWGKRAYADPGPLTDDNEDAAKDEA